MFARPIQVFCEQNILKDKADTSRPFNPVTLANSKEGVVETTLFVRFIETPNLSIKFKYAVATLSSNSTISSPSSS
jgi:hypothetical protein